MTTYNITKDQREKYENERRNCFARYLVHTKPAHQKMYLQKLKSDDMRNDLKDRMREELAKETAMMDTNMRNLRLSRLKQRCDHHAFESGFFEDILQRVKRHLEEKQANRHG